MRSTPGTAALARLAGGFVGLLGAVTLFDIVVVHWICAATGSTGVST